MEETKSAAAKDDLFSRIQRRESICVMTYWNKTALAKVEAFLGTFPFRFDIRCLPKGNFGSATCVTVPSHHFKTGTPSYASYCGQSHEFKPIKEGQDKRMLVIYGPQRPLPKDESVLMANSLNWLASHFGYEITVDLNVRDAAFIEALSSSDNKIQLIATWSYSGDKFQLTGKSFVKFDSVYFGEEAA